MSARRSDDSPQQHAARVSGERRRQRAEEARQAAARRARQSPGVAGHPTWCVCEPCETARARRGDPRIMEDDE